MAFADLREFIAHLEKHGLAPARDRARLARPRDRRDHRPRVQGRRASATWPSSSRTCDGFDMPVLINAFGSPERMAAALGVERLDELVGAGREAPRPAHAGLAVRQAPQAGRPLRPRQGRAQARRARPRARRWSRPTVRPSPRCPILRCWPGDARPLHHAAHGVHARPRHRRAQRRDVPAPGLRRPDARHALADPQGLGRAPARWPRSGASRWRWPSRSAATRARSTRRSAPLPPGVDEMVFAGWLRGSGVPMVPLQDRRPRRAGRGRDRARGLGRSRASGGSRARSATTPATTRSRATIRSSTSRRSRAGSEPDLPDHHRGPPAAGGLLARQGHRAHLPADHPDDAARGGGHEHAGRGRLPQPGDRLDQEALPGPGAQGHVRALGPRAHDAGQEHRGGLRARRTSTTSPRSRGGPPATSIPGATSSSWTGPMDDLDHAAIRHRFGGKLGVDATEKTEADGIGQPWPEEIVMSEDIRGARDAALGRVRPVARARRDRRPPPPRRDQVRAHRLRAALRLRGDGAGGRRLAGLAHAASG